MAVVGSPEPTPLEEDIVFVPPGCPVTLHTFLKRQVGGVGLVADSSTLQQAVLDYRVPVAGLQNWPDNQKQ